MSVPDTRRQSGLWAQNPVTGLYERQPSTSSGPYQYYQPSYRPSTGDRRSFAERTGATTSDYESGLNDPVDTEAVKMNTRKALLLHERVLDSPEHNELVRQLHEHEHGGEAGSSHFAKTGHFNSSLPAALSTDMGEADSDHFSKSRHVNESDLEAVADHRVGGIGGTDSQDLAQTHHINETDLPGEEDNVPENLRTKPWSPPLPEPVVPDQSSRQASAPAEVRRASIPEHSPLQRLERETSKEHKRAQLEEAENRAMMRQGTLGSEKGRVVSDGSRRPSESTSDKFYQHSPRQVSAGSAVLGGLPPTERYQRGIDSARASSDSYGIPAIAKDPRPYHHAPSEPRSLVADQRRSLDANRNAGASIIGNPRPYHHAPTEPRSLHANQNRNMIAAGAGVGAAVAVGAAAAGASIIHSARPYHHAPSEPRSLHANQQRNAIEADEGQSSIVNNPRPYHHAPAEPRSMHSRRSEDVARDARAIPNERGFGTPPIAKEPRPYHHAPSEPRSLAAVQRGQRMSYEQDRTSYEGSQGGAAPYRTPSGNYKHRLRDAGYLGAGAAAAAGAGALAYEAVSADKTSKMYNSRNSGEVSRTGSKKLQKKRMSMDSQRDQNVKQSLQSDRIGGGGPGSGRMQRALHGGIQPDPLSREQVRTHHGDPLPYSIPPQTAAGQAAREQVGFDANPVAGAENQQPEHEHKFGGLFHHHDGEEPRGYQAAKPLEEWRDAVPLALGLGEIEYATSGHSNAGARPDGRDDAWWEKNRGSQQASASRSAQAPVAQYDGPYEEEAQLFRPHMYLKCGPLLRYTGTRHEGGRDIWRGSVMIVSEDSQSDYSPVPTLRLFAQPMELYEPPQYNAADNGQDSHHEDEDPVAGQVKVSRTGRPLYVRPVHEIDGEVDLSREENNQGLYAATKATTLGQQTSTGPDGKQTQHITTQNRSRINGNDGEKAGRYKEVKAIRLHTERGYTFWRWNIEIELGSQQHRVAYRINSGPALGFWVPARGQTMNTMFHSCNGFSLSVDANQFSGPDPLWRDVLNKHQARPFHVMIGGGDQIYNDAAMRDTTLFREWLQTKNPESKHGADFSHEMQEELEEFYLNRYAMWFSQGLFAMAGSQIPMVNLWDDHDIIDGYGSYPHHFMSTRVFTGLGAIAFKYYMLFQHQSVAAETDKEEPSWVLGSSPGPYINELARHVMLDLGPKVKFLGIDCRTERMRDEILSEKSYDILFDRCRAEIRNGETRHLIVLLGVPIAYPRLNFLENILTSRMMDPIKAIGRTGMLGGFVNKFDGGVEILDDLDDHWTAKHHKGERNWFVQELQQLAAEKSVRVTILGGDVHLGAVGQFYTPKKFGVSKDRDHRYMPNVISSAIVNTPPPTMMADVLNRRNKIHHLDHETDEDLIPMFEVDVDGSKRNNKCLLPRRNYCTIREFEPGHTPPPSEMSGADEQSRNTSQQDFAAEEQDRRYPPGSMNRQTSSFSRGPGSLIRRLSSRGKNSPARDQNGATPWGMTRSPKTSTDAPRPQPAANGDATDLPRKPVFHRRPTNLTEKELRKVAARGGAPAEESVDEAREAGHINLEHGLDIRLNMEVDQHDPLGATQHYRLLVPALWYNGAPDVNPARLKSNRGTLLQRFRSRRGRNTQDYSRSASPSPPPDANADRNAQLDGQTSNIAGAGAAQAIQNYSANGAYTNGNEHAASYSKGYNLSPPLGGTNSLPQQQQQQQQQQSFYKLNTNGNNNNNNFPTTTNGASASGYRGTSGPSPPQGQQFNNASGEDDNQSENSWSSDEYHDARTRQPRRLSKAERFFGVGGGGRNGGYADGDGGYGEGEQAVQGKRKKWMVWK